MASEKNPLVDKNPVPQNLFTAKLDSLTLRLRLVLILTIFGLKTRYEVNFWPYDQKPPPEDAKGRSESQSKRYQS